MRSVSGPLKTSLNIVRSVNGIKLPIRCYIAQGINVGSCTYADICLFLKQVLPEFQPATCPPELAPFGIGILLLIIK